MPLIQPRLNSVEEWRFVNHNNDEHPIHVHVNDFQVTEYFDPTTGLRTGPDKCGIDNANVPAPTMQVDESVIQPGILADPHRSSTTYTGLYVMHCHRLNHEDNGLMALINVIPGGLDLRGGHSRARPASRPRCACTTATATSFVATVNPVPRLRGQRQRRHGRCRR